MSIGIFKGVDLGGKSVAFFDKENVAVIEELYSMADAAAEAQLTADLTTVDKDIPVQKVAEVGIDVVEDKSVYELKIEETQLADDDKKDEGVGKPETGRKPSASPGTAVIQSLIFDSKKFTPEQARAWIKSHEGFVDYGMDQTEGSLRFRQYDPKHFERFRTSQLTEGIQAVYGVVGGAQTTESDDNKATDKAEEHAKIKVAVRELNKAINERGLRFLKDSARVAKAEDGTEERFVLSMVLEPNDGKEGAPLKPDTQDDIYSSEEIRSTAHGWMENFGHVDLQHNWQALGKEEVAILESYLVPVDFELGGYNVLKGTWMLGLRVKNDILWDAIKAGEIGAYSVGGTAQRVPVDGEPVKE